MDKQKKNFFLKLKLEILFDNENRSMDYINLKNKFTKDNNDEEEDCEIIEEIKIKEMNKDNFIKIYDHDSVYANIFIFNITNNSFICTNILNIFILYKYL